MKTKEECIYVCYDFEPLEEKPLSLDDNIFEVLLKKRPLIKREMTYDQLSDEQKKDIDLKFTE